MRPIRGGNGDTGIAASCPGGVSLPLTAAQRAIWKQCQADPGTVLWNLGGYLEIDGPLRLDRLAAAVRRATGENEAIRVRFTETAGEPRQVVSDDPVEPFAVVDLREVDDQHTEATRLMWLALDQPMRPSDAPLCEDTMFQLRGNKFYWFRKVHHLVLDGYGSVLMGRRIAALYAGDRGPAGYPPLSRILADEAAYASSARAELDRRFWTDKLRKPVNAVNLAGTLPVPPYRRPIRHSWYWSPQEYGDLRKLASNSSAGMAAVLIALMAAYLSLRTGAPEVSLQVPVTGRIGPAARESGAVLANRLPLRLSPRPYGDPRALVRQAADELLSGLRHQRFRVEDLQTDAQGQLPFQGPKVNIWARGYDMGFDGHRVVERNLHNGPVNDLSLIVYPEPEQLGLRVHLDANPDLYTAEALRGHAWGLMGLFASWCAGSPVEHELSVSHHRGGQRSVW